MALRDWIPSRDDGVLARNGYAHLTDLDEPRYREIIRAMEGFQSEFLAQTRLLWGSDFPIPGDALCHFSRQWEFPYAWANVARTPGRILDAGSGITFFPFLLAEAGFDVDCCDGDDNLGLETRFAQAAEATGCAVRFASCDLTEMPYEDATFDAATCISVLEHTGSAWADIIPALARVVRPGGRLILTFDVDLWRGGGLKLEDASSLLAELGRFFDLAFPLDLRRPAELLTSDSFLRVAPWRLPGEWRPRPGIQPDPYEFAKGHEHFRSIAILGTTAVRRADA